jgi:aminopeptidase-like protein
LPTFQWDSSDGRHGNQIARAYFEPMGSVDGSLDLLHIADNYEMPIFSFDEAVDALLNAKLMTLVKWLSAQKTGKMKELS